MRLLLATADANPLGRLHMLLKDVGFTIGLARTAKEARRKLTDGDWGCAPA